MWACQEGHVDCISELVAAGANINITDNVSNILIFADIHLQMIVLLCYCLILMQRGWTAFRCACDTITHRDCISALLQRDIRRSYTSN